MAKRQSRRRNRGPQRRHLRSAPPSRSSHGDNAEDQELFRELRHGLRSDHPIDLLSYVSGLLEITDPRRRGPFDPEGPTVSLDRIVESFIEMPYAETTAALTCIRTLTTDELLAARIGRELTTRRHPMPDWLARIDDAQPDPVAWFLTEVLGDGDDYFFSIAFPGGQHLSALAYVDHNLGGAVKDAFVVPEPLSNFMEKVRLSVDDAVQTLTTADPSHVRAVVEAAIERGSHYWPPLTSDTWPMSRPLVQWMLRQLPAGGTAPEFKEWTDNEKSELARDFFASPYAKTLDGPDEHDLLDSVLWFGTEYGPCDPLHWSPVSVEILLTDWFPRKIYGATAYLAKLPDLLRGFIRYAHRERGMRADLTEETLAAVDSWESDYQRLIRTERLMGPAGLLAGLLEHDHDDDDWDFPEIMLESLERQVGGRIQLQNLDAEPLPDEPFEWAGIPEDIKPVIEEMLLSCDRCSDELLDVEHRTAMRRFLSRAAVGSPRTFRRKASATRGAAAVAWVICRANKTVGAYWSGLAVQDLLAWFGVKGSVSQRAEPLLRANGVDPHDLFGRMDLETPDLLTSSTRRTIIEQRDRYLAADS